MLSAPPGTHTNYTHHHAVSLMEKPTSMAARPKKKGGGGCTWINSYNYFFIIKVSSICLQIQRDRWSERQTAFIQKKVGPIGLDVLPPFFCAGLIERWWIYINFLPTPASFILLQDSTVERHGSTPLWLMDATNMEASEGWGYRHHRECCPTTTP